MQHGSAPWDKICFAVPMTISGVARVQGREPDDKCIFVPRAGKEFMFHMPMCMDILSITYRLTESRNWLQALFNAAISTP